MPNREILAKLAGTEGAVLADGADANVMQRLAKHVVLPGDHLDVLRIANGISVFGGYFRLFGCRSSVTVDMIDWNAAEAWEFAWSKPLDEFWFFGETAWGDQYAYRRDEVLPSLAPRVFFLEGITMSAEVIADDFSTFLESDFLRNALQPYDENIIAARERLGRLGPLEHVVHVPSPLISAEENVDSLSKMDAIASMIVNGDLCNQLAEEPQDRPIKELQAYEDSHGRLRLRIVWG